MLDKNGVFIRDMSQHFSLDPGFCLANDDRDIYVFGGVLRSTYKDDAWGEDTQILKFDVATHKLKSLCDLECPKLQPGRDEKPDTWHAVLCKNSRNVHLFSKTFGKHVSIPLASLNSARYWLEDNPTGIIGGFFDA